MLALFQELGHESKKKRSPREDKLFRSLCSHKDSVNEFQKPGVYRIPCECGLLYIGETGRNLSLRLKEHKTDCEKAELEKSAVAKHS